MKWRVVVDLIGVDGTTNAHEVGCGRAMREYSSRMIGPTLTERKHILAGCSITWLEPRLKIIAAAGDAANGVGHISRSKMCAPGGCCRCSVPSKSALRALLLADAP